MKLRAYLILGPSNGLKRFWYAEMYMMEGIEASYHLDVNMLRYNKKSALRG